jgi:hypothetical protein
MRMIATLITVLVAACQVPPTECAQVDDLALLESAYVAQVLAECPPERYSAPEACPRYTEIQADYAARRQAWVECRQ